MFSGTNSFSLFFGGCPTKHGLPQKGFPFFSRVTEQLSNYKQITKSRAFCSLPDLGVANWMPASIAALVVAGSKSGENEVLNMWDPFGEVAIQAAHRGGGGIEIPMGFRTYLLKTQLFNFLGNMGYMSVKD